ncbi:SDR family NAD(P)-dependent oxidoreductase [Clostridium estertheticum]|uniref:type I polyketide synthase n=1 Tax=Clostridium estertheticum TaxID=238834 RepID=UPI0013EEBCEB|nr:type I polyketide synthase [Clostridium estertheticum]MBZ9609083.1 SDR family NAD(P)-dependent oxidoreductase [Clostridium estertheticum]
MSKDKRDDKSEVLGGDKGLLFLNEKWIKSDKQNNNEGISNANVMMLFIEEDNPEYLDLINSLSKTVKVIVVKKGASFKKEAQSLYVINSLDGEDYIRLLKDIKEDKLLANYIVFMWDYQLTNCNFYDVDKCGIYSIFNLLKAYDSLKMKMVTTFISLFKSIGTSQVIGKALGGYARSLELVYPKLKFSNIEVGSYDESLVDIIHNEVVLKQYKFSYEVKYENGVRYGKQLEKLHIMSKQSSIKDGGVYLISGGAGALGMIFSEYLAKTYKARIILVGRSTINESIEEKLDLLKGYGAEAIYISCDITKSVDVKKLITEVKKLFGSINGVIHAAGIASKKLIFQKKLNEFKEIINPKIYGTIILDEETKDEKLDFFLAFSSNSSIMGDFGQCDYAIANKFLDSFCSYRNQLALSNERWGRSITINWPLWENGGMHMGDKGEQLYLQTSGMSYLTADSGIKAFEKIMSSEVSQVALISGDRSKIENILKLKKNDAAQLKGSVTNMDNVMDKEKSNEQVVLENENKNQDRSKYDKVEYDVKNVIATILKIKMRKLDVEENLGDFGFDSVSLKEFADRLSDLYKIEISPTVFFAKSTIKDLSEFLLEDFSEEVEKFYSVKENHNDDTKVQGNNVVVSVKEDKPVKNNMKVEEILVVNLKPIGNKYSKENKNKKSKNNSTKDVAIIGMNFKLPGADTEEELWNVLENQEDVVCEIPKKRWDWEKYYSTDNNTENKTNSKWGGFITGQDAFDAKFFSISPREAELMDPQQRLFIQATWKAIEDSGCKVSELAGKNIGVFAGVQFSDYKQLLATNLDKVYAQSSIGNATALLSNRISFMFNFKGPSESIDTACSSSLVALHRAVKSIQYNESEMAIAGGVSLMLDPNTYVGAGVMGVFSPDGRCKTFDSGANGYVKGEGVGVVVLKSLYKAIEDGDNIYGVIKGTAENHGGKANSLTAPNSDAQAEVLLKAYKEAEVDPSTISYIEAHGTGTELGDPVEINGLKKMFKELYGIWDKDLEKDKHIGLGSIKSNIGHLEPASGIAGVIKILISLKKNKLPGVVHFKKLNPYIKLEDSPFYIVDKTKEWNVSIDDNGNRIPRCAGVSSFGFGGTNAHVVIQEYINKKSSHKGLQEETLFILSAKNKDRLKEYALILNEFLDRDVDLMRVAYTLRVGREEMDERLSIVASTKKELQEKLSAFCNGESENKLYVGNVKDVIDGERLTEQINNDIKNEDYDSIAKLWVMGFKVQWQLLFKGNKQNRISVPTYPFARTKYWIPIKYNKESEKTVKGLHEVIDSNISTIYEQGFEKTFRGNEFYMEDHGHVLPGVVYLEMARVAGNLADDENTVTKIKNVIWSNPIIVDKDEKQVRISLQPNSNSIDFKVYSQNMGEREEHAQGRLEVSPLKSNENNEFIDIDQVMRRCKGGEEEARSYYELLSNLGAELGSKFKGIKEFYYNEKEGISRIDVIESLEDTIKDFLLHPTLTDGGLQSSVAFAYKTGVADKNILFVPFILGDIEIFNTEVRALYAYVKQSQVRGVKFDITFLGQKGQVIAKMKELVIRPVQIEFANKISNERENIKKDLVYFTSKWIESPTVLIDKSNSIDGKTLVFSRGTSSEAEIKKLFRDKAIFINFGAEYKKHSDEKFIINPLDLESYNKLSEECKISENEKLNIVYLLDDSRSIEAKEIIKEEIYPIFHLCKWLSSQKFKSQTKMHCIYRNLNNVVEYEALVGFFKSIKLENQKLLCKVVEVRDNTDLVNILKLELSDSSNKCEIKYDSNTRYIKELVEIQQLEDQKQKLKDQGVYIITGGMGGLGNFFAKYLAKKYKAKLILCGRNQNCDLKKINELKDLGAEVIYVPVDISKKEDVITLINKAKNTFNNLNGVINCTGIMKDSLLIKKNLGEIEEVFSPKIYGTINLYNALKNEDIDVFVNFSSSTSLIGNIGQGDYAYANSYIDNYVALMNEKLNRIDTAINWSLWKNGGMNVDVQTEKLLFSKFGMSPLSDENGIKAFEDSLSLNESQVMVIEGVREKIISSLINNQINANGEEKLKVIEVGDNEDTINKFTNELIDIMCEILKNERDEININSDLSEFGFDSITFTELTNKINSKFDLGITPTVFFENSTPIAIAESIYLENDFTLNNYFSVKRVSKGVSKVEEVAPSRALRKIIDKEESTIKFDKINSASREPIAIIGMSGAMPGSENLDEFWKSIEEKSDMISTIPEERWNWERFYGDPIAEPGKTDIKYGGFMKEIDEFDPLFFNISPVEAEKMDPQERIMLQTVWNTMDNSGHKITDLSGTRTSVFIGVSNGDYQELLLKDDIATAMTRTMLTNRISYFFNWSGPSEPVDTACSSSLVAIHRAVESIWHDDCEFAVAGGINLISSPNLFIAGSSLGMLSKDGKCKTFDKDANGYVRGEGVGAILLKPLSKAIRDKDYIHGLIKGTAVNHGGKSNSITSPNSKAQADVIVRAHERASIDPSTVTYIETHGTGTSLGDPVEIEGLKRAFKELFKKWNKKETDIPNCILGSVKSNIGHLESASGMASIFKVLLSMKNKKITGNINFKELNPYIKLEGSGLKIAKDTIPWEALVDENNNLIPRRAGISSFGVGGSNAHIILEEYDNRSYINTNNIEKVNIITVSAKSKISLKESCKNLKKFIGDNVINNKGEERTDNNLELALTKDIVKIFKDVMIFGNQDVILEDSLEEYGVDLVKLIQIIEVIKCEYNIYINNPVVRFVSLKDIIRFMLENYRFNIEQYYCLKDVDKKACSNGNKVNIDINQLAYNLQTRRVEMNERVAFVVDDLKNLSEKLEAFVLDLKDQDGIYEGTANTKRSKFGMLIEGEEGRLFIDKLLVSRKFDKIAQLWIEGIDIDWSKLYDDEMFKMPMPGYAFDKERYWLPKPRNASYEIYHNNKLEDNEVGKELYSSKEAIDELDSELIYGDEEELLELLTKVQNGEISAEAVNMLVEDLL